MAGEEAGEDEERAGIMEGTMEGSGKVLQAGGGTRRNGPERRAASERSAEDTTGCIWPRRGCSRSTGDQHLHFDTTTTVNIFFH